MLSTALDDRFPGFWSRILDEYRWSLIAILVASVCVYLDLVKGAGIHRMAPPLAAGVTAFVGIAVSASLASVSGLLGGSFPNARSPEKTVKKIVAVVWNNLVWLICIAIFAIAASVISAIDGMGVVGAIVPGLAALSLFRTYLVTRETFRIYIALVVDHFDGSDQ